MFDTFTMYGMASLIKIYIKLIRDRLQGVCGEFCIYNCRGRLHILPNDQSRRL